jgi:hypothetical protein
MKTLLAATSIAIALAAGAFTAHAQGPFPPGGPLPGRDFREPVRPGVAFDGPGYPGFRRHPAPPIPEPVYRPHHGRHFLPPEAPCPPQVYCGPRFFDFLRFVYRR